MAGKMSEQSYLAGKIEDLIEREARGETMVFSSFLTPEEGVIAASLCQKARAPHLLFGGYEESERKMLAVSSMEQEVLCQCFPIALLRFEGELSEISNRDVLGALMATGIRRDVLGDIIVRDGLVLAFVADHIKEFIINNVSTIGRQNVKVCEAPYGFEIPKRKFETMRVTVASPRIDAVVGGLAHLSREQACRLIEGKMVYLNHTLQEKKTREIHAGDSIVIRGSGKWIIDECGDLTKKGRTVIISRKYI